MTGYENPQHSIQPNLQQISYKRKQIHARGLDAPAAAAAAAAPPAAAAAAAPCPDAAAAAAASQPAAAAAAPPLPAAAAAAAFPRAQVACMMLPNITFDWRIHNTRSWRWQRS